MSPFSLWEFIYHNEKGDVSSLYIVYTRNILLINELQFT